MKHFLLQNNDIYFETLPFQSVKIANFTLPIRLLPQVYRKKCSKSPIPCKIQGFGTCLDKKGHFVSFVDNFMAHLCNNTAILS